MEKYPLRSKGNGSFLGVRETSVFDLAGDEKVREALQDMKRFMRAGVGRDAKEGGVIIKVTVKSPKKKSAA